MINKGIYFVLSAANLAALLYFAGEANLLPAAVLFLGILFNQFLLVKGVGGMVRAQKKSAFLILKFLVLIPVFIYAMKAMPDRIVLCVTTFIFQLIILILSIKRDSKKN